MTIGNCVIILIVAGCIRIGQLFIAPYDHHPHYDEYLVNRSVR